MLTLFAGLALLATMGIGSTQALDETSCCTFMPAAAPASEPPPPPQGTNKGLLTEPMPVTSLVDAVVSRSSNEGTVKTGPYLKVGTGVSGAGWVSAGPGYRQLFNDRVLVDMSAVVSWRQYMTGRARAELRPLANRSLIVGAQVLAQDWTQVQFYGRGPDSLETNRSMYRLRATDVSAYAAVSPARAFDLRVRAGMLNRPRISAASGWHRADHPDTQSRYTDFSAPGLFAQPRFWHGDVSVTTDTLDHADHPTRGFLLELVASEFRDRDLSRFSFRRYEATTVAFVPLIGNLWTIGARGMVVSSETSGVNEVPFYMLPSLGKTVLRGFDSGRFHDRNLIALNVESRWAVFQHLDLAVFADYGRVAPRFKDLNGDLESSYGAGLRLHTGAATFLRIDAAKARGGGGWRVLVKLNESLSFSKDERWATVVPVVR